MEIPINSAIPTLMHIDLNSCFASIEQQARPLLRNKPVAIAPYKGPSGSIISLSQEAKKSGVKANMKVSEAYQHCPSLLVLEPDPEKYRAVNQTFMQIFSSYSPTVIPKSIDEAIIDFSSVMHLQTKPLIDTARDIQLQLSQTLGEYITCSIGIGTNSFLAKVGASYFKPNGLLEITHTSLLSIYANLSLTDLYGINKGFQRHLYAQGIFTPLQFFYASLQTLQYKVFHGISGYYWYQQLRGWETNSPSASQKTYNQSYVLPQSTDNARYIQGIIMKLTEKMTQRMRSNICQATHIELLLTYDDYSGWNKSYRAKQPLYITHDFYKRFTDLLPPDPLSKKIKKISITCSSLEPHMLLQPSLFSSDENKKLTVSNTIDSINTKHGAYTLSHANTLYAKQDVKDRIAFGKM